MRKLASLASKEHAEQFRFFLHQQGIEVYHEAEGEEEQCEIWILADADLAAAQHLWEEFSRNPLDAQIKDRAYQGKKLLLQRQKDEEAAQKAARRRQRFEGNFITTFPVTSVVIAVSVVFFIFGYFSQGLEIKKFLLFSTAYADYVLGQKSFQEILSGQVWRLVTPIFIHHGIFHIFFNLAWFSTLARQIEGYLSSRKLLLLILGIAIPSNIAFYLIASPAFGGLSGVNYGLFAYLWCRGNYSTDSALRPDQQLSQFFFVWYIICLALTLLGGMFGMKVANSIHGVGALMGIVFAVVDTHSLRQVLNTFKFNQHTRKLALIGLGLLIAGFVVDYLSMRGIS